MANYSEQVLRETIDKMGDTYASVVQFINYQVLGNVDQIAFQLQKELKLTAESKSMLDQYLESMVKSPLRKQVNRLNNLIVIVQDVKNNKPNNKPEVA